MFELHPKLQQDCLVIGKFPLCYLLLMNDSNFPWFILVPERENITEIYQLEEPDQIQLTKESAFLAKNLASHFVADKINIAALGNKVSQLHIHHIIRYQDDIAWPAPVWDKADPVPYTEQEIDIIVGQLHRCLTENFTFTIDTPDEINSDQFA